MIFSYSKFLPNRKVHGSINQTLPVKPIAPAGGFLFGGNKAWRSKPYAHASRPSAPKLLVTHINPNQDGDMVAAADLGDANATRYSSAISSLAKFVDVLAVSLSLITSSTLPVAALTMTTTSKPFVPPAINRKLTPKAKKFKIFLAKKTGGSQFIFWANPADTTPPPTRKKNPKLKLFFHFSDYI